jgi:hypothetical protein
MAKKRKRKLTAIEKAAKKRRRQEYQTVFINGKMKRIRRPPTIDGVSVDEFIRNNADPIFLHQEGLWEYLEPTTDPWVAAQYPIVLTPIGRESVAFIATETGDDLVVGYAIALAEPGEVISLILQRNPRFEVSLPRDERGVSVSHEALAGGELELATRIVVRGFHVDIETTAGTYQIDLSAVDPEEIASARDVLLQMHRHGGFSLDMR